MDLQRVSVLAKKDLKKTVREPAALLMTLLFPAVLTLVFGVAFGGIGGDGETLYLMGVVDMDPSIGVWTGRLMGNLTETGLIELRGYTENETAQGDLIQGRIHAVLLIPEDFDESCDSFWAAPADPGRWLNTTLQLYLDSGSMLVTQAVPPIVSQAIATTIYGKRLTTMVTPVQVGTPTLIQTTSFTIFDYMAPGLFAYAAIFLIMVVAQSFTYERENGLLRRINVTPTTPAEFMAGQVLSNMVIALVQMALVFAGAFFVGFRPSVDVAGMVFAFAIASVFSLCCVGFGLITATLARSSGTATGISFLFIMPQMLLGTFIPTGTSSLMKTAAKFVPSHYVTEALISLLLRGAPPSSPAILLDTAMISLSSILILIAGIILFQRYGKS